MISFLLTFSGLYSFGAPCGVNGFVRKFSGGIFWGDLGLIGAGEEVVLYFTVTDHCSSRMQKGPDLRPALSDFPDGKSLFGITGS